MFCLGTIWSRKIFTGPSLQRMHIRLLRSRDSMQPPWVHRYPQLSQPTQFRGLGKESVGWPSLDCLYLVRRGLGKPLLSISVVHENSRR